MCTTKKEKVFLLFAALICATCFCEIGCKRSDRSRGSSRSRHGAQDLNVHYGAAGRISGDQQQQQQQQQIDGTKIGSAPTALDSRFNSPPKDLGLEQVNKQAVDPLLSPNPQKPTGWNVGGSEMAQRSSSSGDLKTKASEDLPENKINLRSYPSTTYPNKGSYNYYGVGDSYNYGNGYQSDSQQPFPGYRSTSNIGVVPPKGVNIADYYGSMLNVQNPNNAGIFGRLFSGQKQGYSYGFGNNAYKNVLAGLLIWNLMHGLTNYRYNVYNHYNRPEMIPRNMSLGAGEDVECPQNVTMICETSTRALCTTNGTIMCISSCTNATEGVPENPAADATCAKNKNCVTDVTIVDEAGRESVFCVTTFGVPQVPEDDDPCKSGNAELCLPNSSTKSSVELNVPVAAS